MSFLAPFEAVDRAIGRQRDVQADQVRAERTVLVSLATYVLLWAVYGTIAKSSQGLHYDMTEAIAWSRDLSLGYLKHPPLAAAVVWAWFSVFPVGEFSYYLLAMLMPGLALWVVWRLSVDYLEPDKRIVGLALLMLVPFFNFHALKFNVNTVLMPLWAATTFWFLRSVTTRSHVYAALAGLGAAGCMLGKYWSVFLLAGLVVTALIDRRRAIYFKSPAPWITLGVGLTVLAPHLVWLAQNDFATFTYAMTIHGDKPFGDTVIAALGYLAGSLGYVAFPVILVLTVARPGRAAFADLLWPMDPARRLVAAAFWAPALLPTLGALAFSAEITSLWSMPAWTLLPVLLLSSPEMTIKPIETRRILLIAVVPPLVMLIAAPAIAIMIQRKGPWLASAQASLLAAQVERAWNEVTPQPLRFVGGDEEIAYGVIAYAEDRPRALPHLPPPSEAELKSSGMVLVCFAQNAGCRRDAEALAVRAGTSRTIESTIVRNFWRQPGKPQRYTIVIVPPRR